VILEELTFTDEVELVTFTPKPLTETEHEEASTCAEPPPERSLEVDCELDEVVVEVSTVVVVVEEWAPPEPNRSSRSRE
jgi:hypothetical protein